MSSMASQITSLSIVYSTVCSGSDQGKHQSSASLAFVCVCVWGGGGGGGFTREFPAKRASNAEMCPFGDVIMLSNILVSTLSVTNGLAQLCSRPLQPQWLPGGWRVTDDNANHIFTGGSVIWQPAMPPVTRNLVSWQLSASNVTISNWPQTLIRENIKVFLTCFNLIKVIRKRCPYIVIYL